MGEGGEVDAAVGGGDPLVCCEGVAGLLATDGLDNQDVGEIGNEAFEEFGLPGFVVDVVVVVDLAAGRVWVEGRLPVDVQREALCAAGALSRCLVAGSEVDVEWTVASEEFVVVDDCLDVVSVTRLDRGSV